MADRERRSQLTQRGRILAALDMMGAAAVYARNLGANDDDIKQAIDACLAEYGTDTYPSEISLLASCLTQEATLRSAAFKERLYQDYAAMVATSESYGGDRAESGLCPNVDAADWTAPSIRDYGERDEPRWVVRRTVEPVREEVTA